MAPFGFGKKSRPKKDFDGMNDDLTAQLRLLQTQTEAFELEALREKTNHLILICRALWSFIQEHHEMSEADLTNRMEALKRKEGTKCTECGRTLNRHHNRCLYCGAEGSAGTAFDQF